LNRKSKILKALSIYPAGENALTVCLGDKMDMAINDRIFKLFQYLQRHPNPFWNDLIPAYCTLTIVYDVVSIRKHHPSAFTWVQNEMERALFECEVIESWSSRKVNIPVCYDFAFGLDLKILAKTRKLSVDEVIAFHTQQTYRVYMLGFLPGFAYMGIVNNKISAPRLSAPRKHVPAGSVGIAGNQTGIYPLDSPGGWNIIGRTPLQLFTPMVCADTDYRGDKTSEGTYVLLQPGDEVTFFPITKEAFDSFDVQNFNLLST
jgi:inhibitor of KinA